MGVALSTLKIFHKAITIEKGKYIRHPMSLHVKQHKISPSTTNLGAKPPVSHMISDSLSGWHSRREFTGFNDCGPSLLHWRDELIVNPLYRYTQSDYNIYAAFIHKNLSVWDCVLHLASHIATYNLNNYYNMNDIMYSSSLCEGTLVCMPYISVYAVP